MKKYPHFHYVQNKYNDWVKNMEKKDKGVGGRGKREKFNTEDLLRIQEKCIQGSHGSLSMQ